MPSRKIFSLRPKGGKGGSGASLLPFIPLSLFTIALLLSGCMAVDESKSVFDIPLADDYQPTLSRDKSFTPQRILVLPVTGDVDPNFRQTFQTEMMSKLKQSTVWTVVEYDQSGSGEKKLAVDRYNAYRRARAVGADSVLFVQLGDEEIYSPIRISATVSMERVDQQTPALNSRFDFDTRNQNVTDSARRYYQEKMKRTFGSEDAPDKSMYIVNNNEPFMQFAGFYTAKLINDAYAPSPDSKSSPPSSTK